MYICIDFCVYTAGIRAPRIFPDATGTYAREGEKVYIHESRIVVAVQIQIRGLTLIYSIKVLEYLYR